MAAAIIKLWEKSLVVKIAVKRGVQNTNNELMAEELKVCEILPFQGIILFTYLHVFLVKTEGTTRIFLFSRKKIGRVYLLKFFYIESTKLVCWN